MKARDVVRGRAIGHVIVLGLLAGLACAGAPSVARAEPTFSQARSTVFDWLPPLGPGGAATSPDGTLLYVTGTVSNDVWAYSTASGQPLFAFGGTGTGPGRFRRPQGIAVDPYGEVYVADAGNGRVQRFSRTGVFRRAWDSPFARGIAAGPAGSVFVLGGLGNVVQRRSYDGKDLGAWPVAFADGYDRYGLYGPPRTAASVGIAADRNGDILVAGDVAQDRGAKPNPCRPPPKYPNLAPHPPVLRGPTVGRFSPEGSPRDQIFTASVGPVCFGTNPSWQYSASGKAAAGAPLASDPATGDVYSAVQYAEPDWGGFWFLTAYDPDPGPGQPAWSSVGIPSGNPLQDSQPNSPSSQRFGEIRAATIDCRRRLFSVLERRIVRYTPADPTPGGRALDCRVRNRWVVLGAATVAPRSPRSDVPARALVRATCPPGTTCRGDVSLTVRPVKCRTCRGVTLTAPFRTGGGRDAVVAVALSRRARALIAGGATSVVRGRGAGGLRVAGPAASLPLQLPSSLSATCRADGAATAAAGVATVAGRLAPAGAGRPVRLVAIGPNGAVLRRTVRTGPGGRYAARISLPADGAWTVRADGAASATRAPAGAGCAALTPGTPGTVRPEPIVTPGDLTTSPPGGPAAPTFTLGCARLPGGALRGSGALLPGFEGSLVTVRAEPLDPATGLPTQEATVGTAADGSYAADLAVPPGAYRLTARYAGDPARSASQAGPCDLAS